MFNTLSELFSLRDLRNALLGGFVVLGGLALAALTVYAHQTNNIRLAGISAGASLLFVLVILVFIVPPLARNAGREAAQLNLPFEFTTGGAIMLVLVVIVGFSAWNTGNNLLFIVLSFLIATMVVGFFAGSICLKKLDIKMRFPDTIFAGGPTPILVSLTNRKRVLPAFSVVAEVRGKERERSIVADNLEKALPGWIARRLGKAPVIRRTLNHFVYLARSSSSEVRTEHVFDHRGRLVIKDFELTTRFPFGFFRHRRRLPARAAEIVILPKLVPVRVEIDDRPSDAGARSTGYRGSGLDLLAMRDYQPHDDPRHIDWKATARSRRLTVREFANEDELRVTVIFDPFVPHDPNKLKLRERLAAEQAGKPVVVSERFEAGASLAASILSHFARQNALFRFVVGDDEGDTGSGDGHLHEELKRLAVIEPKFLSSPNSSEPSHISDRILNDTADSHRFLITANGSRGLSPEIVQTLKIIEF